MVVHIVTSGFKALKTAEIEQFVAAKVPGSWLGHGTLYPATTRGSPQNFRV